jgi:hypothetical protein
MAGQKPRQGWIYRINPSRVSLRCKQGHVHIYDLKEPSQIECNHKDCTEKLNASRVLRGSHPHLVWTSEQFRNNSDDIQTFAIIPLSSREIYKGLPTVYPINPTQRNELDSEYYALIHQIYTVDGNCFKDSNHHWLKRIGQLDKSDKEAIEKRLHYFLVIQDNPDGDWFCQNASPELTKKVFYQLSEDERNNLIDEFLGF